MLYKSLQQTILQYEKRKQSTQSQGDKKVFKWKVIALSLCILTIVLIGILSQLIENHKQQSTNIHNLTFLPEILKQSYQLQNINNIKNLVSALNKSPRIIFNHAQLILGSSNYNIQPIQLLQKINKKNNILFIFNLVQTNNKQNDNNDQQQQDIKQYRFGMLLKQDYDSQIDADDNVNIQIQDGSDDRTSVYMNLNKSESLIMQLSSGCRLYNFNKTTGDLIIMQTLLFKHYHNQQQQQQKMLNNNNLQTNNNKLVQFKVIKQQCFANSSLGVINQIRKLTGIQLSQSKSSIQLIIKNIQIFYLTFNQQHTP